MSRFFRALIASALLLSLTGAGCTKALPAETIKASQRMDLNVWGVVDDVDAYQTLLADYRAQHPNVQINYRRLRLEEYETRLLEAFAEDRGPDIFLIHNDWVSKYLSKLTPMPASTTVAAQVVSGTIKKDLTWELQTDTSITLRDYKDQFADVAVRDTLRKVNVTTNPNDPVRLQERLVAAPLWLDTLALYYNKDLLNTAGIPTPPENWTQFQEQAKKLTQLDTQGKIVQSAVGMGTISNVERATDLLSVLMVQNGAQMVDENGIPIFDHAPDTSNGERTVPPSLQALEFYTDFANPAKETYTWNNQMPNSLEAFIQGRAAFFFGYSYHADQIRARAPKLNLGITKLPQIEGNPVKNFANYWVWGVAKKAKNPDLAWNFLNFMMRSKESKKVLDVIKRPAARKSLLADQFQDETVGVFASQVLTATSWYRGNNPKVVDDAFKALVEEALAGSTHLPEAMQFAATKIRQTVVQ